MNLTDAPHMHTYDEAGEHVACPVDACWWTETWSPGASTQAWSQTH